MKMAFWGDRRLVVSKRMALSLRPRILVLLGLVSVAEGRWWGFLETLKGLEIVPFLQEGVKLVANQSDPSTVRRLLEVMMDTRRLSLRDELTGHLVIEAMICMLERKTDLEAASQLLVWLGKWLNDAAFDIPPLLEEAMTVGYALAGWDTQAPETPEVPEKEPLVVEEVFEPEPVEINIYRSPWYFDSLVPRSNLSHEFVDTLVGLTPVAAAYFVRRNPFEEATRWLDLWPVPNRALLLGAWARGRSASPEEIEQVETLLDHVNQMRKAAVRDMGEEDVIQLLLYDRENCVRRAVDKLWEVDSEMADKLSNGYFEFEDLAHLQERDLSIFLAESRVQDIAMGLQGASEKLKLACLAAMPPSRAANLRIYLSHLGPVDPILVDCHRGTLMSTLRALELDDKIEINMVARNISVES